MPLGSRRIVARTWLNTVPFILMLMGLTVIVIAAPRVLRPPFAPPVLAALAQPPTPPDPLALQKELEELARRVDTLKTQREGLEKTLGAVSQQAAQTQWQLTIVLAALGLLTLAQGLFAFFSAQNYVKQADEAVKKLEALVTEVRTRYPMLSEMENAREAAFARLEVIKKKLLIDQNLYATSEPQDRQEVLALESFAATQFLASGARGAEVVGNLRLLGKFYGDKYVHDGRRSRTDFERALYYFSLARDKSPQDPFVLNDLGWLQMEVAEPSDPRMAETYFRESRRLNPDHQRALYNLGTLLMDPSDPARLREAREHLERALNLANWEDAPNQEFACYIPYNLACTYSRLAGHETTEKAKKKLLDLCVNALDKAAERAGIKEETLDRDLGNRGRKDLADLAELARSDSHKAQLNAVLEKLRRTRQARAARGGA